MTLSSWSPDSLKCRVVCFGPNYLGILSYIFNAKSATKRINAYLCLPAAPIYTYTWWQNCSQLRDYKTNCQFYWKPYEQKTFNMNVILYCRTTSYTWRFKFKYADSYGWSIFPCKRALFPRPFQKQQTLHKTKTEANLTSNVFSGIGEKIWNHCFSSLARTHYSHFHLVHPQVKMSFSLVGGISGFQDFRVSEFQVGNHMVEDGISGGKEVVQRQGR